MKTEIQRIRFHDPGQLQPKKRETATDRRVLVEIGFGTLAGVISYIAAMLTTFVEVHGFWRPFWLAVCIGSFICAVALISEGVRKFGKRA
jgi:hypothetical protein